MKTIGSKGWWKQTGAIVLGALIFLTIKQMFFSSEIPFDRALVKTSYAINKSCPFMINETTRLDNTVALPNLVFLYNYTLINDKVEDIDLALFNTELEQQMISNIRNSVEMKSFRENDVELKYSYKDKNGAFISEISITPEKYKK